MRTLADLVPLRTPACKDALDAVAMMAAGEGGVEWTAAAHVQSCLRCQAEVLAYRRVLATMRDMRGDVRPFPAGSVPQVLRAIHPPAAVSPGLPASGGVGGADGAPPPVWAVRAAYVGGITAASAAGVIVWFSRRRLGLAPASGPRGLRPGGPAVSAGSAGSAVFATLARFRTTGPVLWPVERSDDRHVGIPANGGEPGYMVSTGRTHGIARYTRPASETRSSTAGFAPSPFSSSEGTPS